MAATLHYIKINTIIIINRMLQTITKSSSLSLTKEEAVL